MKLRSCKMVGGQLIEFEFVFVLYVDNFLKGFNGDNKLRAFYYELIFVCIYGLEYWMIIVVLITYIQHLGPFCCIRVLFGLELNGNIRKQQQRGGHNFRSTHSMLSLSCKAVFV